MERKPYVPKKSMKWFNFLIYFGLFFLAAVNLINAINILAGRVYGYDAEYIYYFFEGMQSLDILYGIAFIVLAVLCIVSRFALAKRKKSGIKMINITSIVAFVVNIVYVVCAFLVLSELFSDFISSVSDVDAMISLKTTVIVNTVLSIIMTVANLIYFKKRKDLFE